MKQRILTLIFLACMAVTGTVANDASFWASGNQLVPLRETSIRVTKEILSIDLRDDGMAYVDVYYEFTNPESTAKTLLMGFEADPPYPDGGPDGWSLTSHSAHPYIENFTVEINGQRQTYRNAISHPGKFHPMKVEGMTITDGGLAPMEYNEEGDYYTTDGPQEAFAFVYYFNATFRPGITKVHHTYRYKMGSSVYSYYFLDYKLTPATRWANHQIDDFTLILSAKQTAKHFYLNRNCVPGLKPVVASGKAAEIYAFKMLTELRRKNISVASDFGKRTMKAQMKAAAKSGAKFALIVGDEEVTSSTVTVKNLETSAQEKISLAEVPDKIS